MVNKRNDEEGGANFLSGIVRELLLTAVDSYASSTMTDAAPKPSVVITKLAVVPVAKSGPGLKSSAVCIATKMKVKEFVKPPMTINHTAQTG